MLEKSSKSEQKIERKESKNENSWRIASDHPNFVL
jgi:hypothetical protein